MFAGWVALAALATVACDPRVNLGAIGDGGANLLWRATFEPGDLSEWTSGGNGGTYVENAPGVPSATAVLAHNGRYAGIATVAPAMGMDSFNYFYRDQPSPPEAYYSAWFFIPSSFAVRSWLSLHHFRSSRTGDGNNLFGIWDINLIPLPGGQLVAQLYDFVTQFNLQQTAPIPVPLDTWVHFEVLLRKAADSTGRIAVWQDGVLILDRTAIRTTQMPWVRWEAGASTDNVAPSPASVYIDDAAISLSRLGVAGN